MPTIAYCIVPKIGGTYRFYCYLKAALAPYGWRVYGVSMWDQERALWQTGFADPDCVCIGPTLRNPLEIAHALVSWMIGSGVDVFIPMDSQIGASAVPHLPKKIHIINRCSNITRHAYDIVCNNTQYVSRIVSTSERQYRDLSAKRHVSIHRLSLIPHGLDIEFFRKAASLRTKTQDLIRLGYVGCLEHQDKGCLHLIALTKRLVKAKLSFRLDIVGSGPQEAEMQKRLAALVHMGRVRFLGSLVHTAIPLALSDVDILVMPSHFEGFGFSLVEAMAAGCVPVVSRIVGVTDWIVRHGETGFVCPIGDMRVFSSKIVELAQNREQWATMSITAQKDIADRFDLARMGREYVRVLRDVLLEPIMDSRPHPWSAFRLDPVYAPTWRRYVPQFLKNLARYWGVA